MKQFSIKIMGAPWTIKYFSETGFLEEHPEHGETSALTVPTEREIHFQEDHIDIGTVRHEVRHAFTSELCLHSAALSIEQFEEIQCCLDELRYDDMADVSQTVFEKLQRYHKSS